MDERLVLSHWAAKLVRRKLTPAEAKERRRIRDRNAKRRRYAADPAYKQARLDRERARYEQHGERIRARMRVENLSPERVELQRVRAGDRYRRERRKRLAYNYEYHARPAVKARRRELYRAKAILRAALEILDRRVDLEVRHFPKVAEPPAGPLQA